jgi:eight-cysteine-cluster-containing protein
MRNGLTRWSSEQSLSALVGGGALLCMALLVGGAKSCQTIAPTEPMCMVPIDCVGLPHLDCGGNWSCGDSMCNWICGLDTMDCLTSADCLNGDECAPSLCEPCAPDTTCPPCTGTCVEPPPIEGQCAADGDCTLDQICIVDCPVCPGDAASCPPCTGTCIDDPKKFYDCEEDDDCEDWETCEIAMCANVPCDKSSDNCPESNQCWGLCTAQPLAAGQCYIDDDCDDGMGCDDSACKKGPPCKGDNCPPCVGACLPEKPAKECIITGCSGQICADQPMNSDCAWLPKYACFKLTTCEVLANDQCGWVETSAFLQCLDQAEASGKPIPAG